MTEFFIAIFQSIDNYVGEAGVFLIAFSILTVAFLVALLLTIFAHDYVFLKRVWYFFVLLGISGIQLFVHVLCKSEKAYALLTFSIGLIYAVPLLTLRARKFCTDKQIDLAKFISEKEQRGVDLDGEAQVERLSCDFSQSAPIKFSETSCDKQVCDVDFSHVKNVLARLEYLSLSANDKRLIKDLQANVYAVESGDCTFETKSKINDGLGALLKIMSKYGV